MNSRGLEEGEEGGTEGAERGLVFQNVMESFDPVYNSKYSPSSSFLFLPFSLNLFADLPKMGTQCSSYFQGGFS